MKPHLAHINNTIIKKQLADDAKNTKTSYAKYRAKIDKALANGYPKQAIIDELEHEVQDIMLDERDGDPIFKQGVHNAKVACISSIRTIIAELKGEN